MKHIHLTFHGAAQQVTGSCTLFECGSTRILVDCGIAHDSYQNELPFDPSTIDAVIMTHAHLDHTGCIPMLFEKGFIGNVYGHYATGEIASLIWEDTLSIGIRNGTPLYGKEAFQIARKKVSYHDYNEPFAIGDTQVSFHDAGHILGSSHVSVAGNGKRVLFSGDIGVVNTPIINDPTTTWTESFDGVVIESTYGNRTHKDRAATIEEFGTIVQRIIDQRGVLLVPAFAIGRTQEILYHLNTLVETGKIPKLPVFLDSPMGCDVTALYRSYTVCYDNETCLQIENGDLPFDFPGLKIIDSFSQSRSIANVRPPFIVVAGSGMCTGGRILGHLATFLPEKTTTVMIVGWQGRGTLGRSLIDISNGSKAGVREVVINNTNIPVRASVATLNGFSAHADNLGLLTWAEHVPGESKRWFVNHGEPAATEALAECLEGCGFGKARSVRVGERFVV